jgi:glycerol-3-phosphate dehydrogenase
MIRDLATLSSTRFDVLVVGAGIHGAFIAWDAAQRGLRVAVIDAGDFGGATSANSLKVIHGGLRYLQQVNLKRVVESIRERAIWLSIAPDLVRPMQFMVPTRGHGKEGRLALAAAMRLNDWLGAAASRGIPVDHRIEPGEVVDRATALRLAPALVSNDFDGAAIWCDAQAANTERLTLAAVVAAVGHGATAANYVRCEDVRVENGKVAGARLRDVLADASMDVEASTIVNATGTTLRISGERESASVGAPPRALAVNLITRPVSQTVAFGVRSTRSGQEDPIGGGRRYLFLAPWRSSALVGTFYRPWHEGAPPRVSEELIASILEECNEACPGLSLTRADVRRVHVGLLPLEDPRPGSNGAHARAIVSAPLLKRARIIEDSAHGGPRGLVSVFGIKYTTARRVAEETVNVIYRTLGFSPPPCRTASAPRALEMSSSPAVASGPLLQGTDAGLARLRAVYGSAASAVLSDARGRDPRAAEPLAPGCEVLRAEVVHAVTTEMAIRLSDVVFRRTDLASEMPPADAALAAAADLTGSLLGWSPSKRHEETAEVRAAIQL